MERLFYQDCHIRSFSATVTGCTSTDKGFLVTLDATAFYPEGGGQACDIGTLGCARVLDVREREEEILHLCDQPLPVGSTVEGTIDWQRRFDLMQQHTGEHILSGIIHRRYGHGNSGFHIGADVLTVDFDGPIPPEDLRDIEEEANRAIWENLPVICSVPSAEALPTIPYRTKRPLPWPVRIVEVKNYDLCACCGVHVKNTGEVGLIKLLSCVKFHQGVRIEMLCGGRAFYYLSQIYEQNRQVSAAFSAKPLETGAAARHMNDLLSNEKYRLTAVQRKYFDTLASRFAGQAYAVHFEESLTPGELRELASRMALVCSGVSAVFSGCDTAGYGLCLAGDPEKVKTLGEKMTVALKARGGGKAGFFQGNTPASQEEILAFCDVCRE